MSIKYLDNGVWSSVPGTAGSFASPTKQHERYTATGAVTAIPITTPIRPGDMLTVLRDNLPLVEGVDYTRAEHQVTLTVATIAGTVIDTDITHYDIAPLRSHVDDMADPHHTLAYITQDLQAGDILKYDGSKLVKAVEGVDYGATVGANSNSRWAKYADGTMVLTMDYVAAASISVAAGQVFRGNAGIPPDFPVAFAAPPKTQITLYDAFGMWLGGTEKLPSTTNATDKSLLSLFSWQKVASAPITVSIHAFGRWK